MKHAYKKVSVISFLVILIVTLSINTGKTNISAPPLGGLSGDPGRTSCALIGCHYGTEYAFATGDLDLNMGDSLSALTPMAGQSYIPGHTYYIEVRPNLSNGHGTRYGFQLTSLDPTNAMAGAFTVTDASNNSTQSLLGRDYIGHKGASSFNDWTFQWTAPATSVGRVTFYYACNIANGNGDNSGDSIYKGNTYLDPYTASGIINPVNISISSLYPNPIADAGFLNLCAGNEGPAVMNLIDMNGRSTQIMQLQLQKGPNAIQFNRPNQLAQGIYMLDVEMNGQHFTKRVVLM